MTMNTKQDGMGEFTKNNAMILKFVFKVVSQHMAVEPSEFSLKVFFNDGKQANLGYKFRKHYSFTNAIKMLHYLNI